MNHEKDDSAEQFPKREFKTEPFSKATFYVEEAEDGFWTYLQRSAGKLPDVPLHKFLNWLLAQLNLGNFEVEIDALGDVVSTVIGRQAAAGTVDLPGTWFAQGELRSADEASERAEGRLRAVYITGLLAGCRESGIRPEHAPASTMFTQQATDWGHRNTEFYYAFELAKVLARVNKKTFRLEAPPIGGLAPRSVVAYLRESTRCWLYGFHGASVALCRACVEGGLKARLEVSGELEALIDAAGRRKVLDDCGVKMAHAIRKTGNDFLHGRQITERQTHETLDATRSIVEQLFQTA